MSTVQCSQFISKTDPSMGKSTLTTSMNMSMSHTVLRPNTSQFP